MMSYLWILLIGSLLASHARAQEEGEEPPTTSDPVTEKVSEVEEEFEVETDPETTATQEPQLNNEDVPDPDPESEAEEAVIPSASDPEPTAAEEEEEEEEEDEDEAETVADENAGALEAEDLGITTEAPVDESDQILTTVEPADEIDHIFTTAEPETEEEVETTTSIDEAEVATEGSAETPTPTLITEPTTVAETSATTQAANLVVIDEEAKQTTTLPPPPKTTEIKEVPLSTRAPAQHEEITTIAEVSGVEETTPFSILGNVVNEIKSEVINVVRQAGTRMGFSHDTSSEPEADTSGRDPSQSGEGGSKPLAAVLSGIVVAAVGAVAGYFTYQKKKLCFKKKPEADPEAGNKGEKVDPADAQSNPETLAPLVDKH